MKKLIVNADDYGYTSNISRGIRDSYTKGILTATSAIMNYRTSVNDIYIAMEEIPEMAIGVHLNLYKGTPLAPLHKVKTLVNNDGIMLGKQNVINKNSVFNIEDMETECRAQIELFLSTGCKLDHINTHGIDSICFSTNVWELFVRLSKEYKCAIRVPINWGEIHKHLDSYCQYSGLTKEQVMNKYEEQMNFITKYHVFHADQFKIFAFYEQNSAGMIKYLNDLPEGLTEYACHAGYSDTELEKMSTVTDERDKTVGILVDPLVRKTIEDDQIELTTYSNEYELLCKD